MKTPVRIVMMVKTSHIRNMDQRRRGRRPTRAGRKAKPTEQAKLNMAEVAVIRVWLKVLVIPTSLSICVVCVSK